MFSLKAGKLMYTRKRRVRTSHINSASKMASFHLCQSGQHFPNFSLPIFSLNVGKFIYAYASTHTADAILLPLPKNSRILYKCNIMDQPALPSFFTSLHSLKVGKLPYYFIYKYIYIYICIQN